jgi:hypothetical protein
MTFFVHAACAATALLCFGLLARAWWQSRVPLLFWCAVCFLGLAIGNALLLVPDHAVPGFDLVFWRKLPSLLGLLLLNFGLIQESRP